MLGGLLMAIFSKTSSRIDDDSLIPLGICDDVQQLSSLKKRKQCMTRHEKLLLGAGKSADAASGAKDWDVEVDILG